MGQLERYGLYVLVVVIFLILGVAIMGDDPGRPPLVGAPQNSTSRAPTAQLDVSGFSVPTARENLDALFGFGEGEDVAFTPPAPAVSPDPVPVDPVLDDARIQDVYIADVVPAPAPVPAPGTVKPRVYRVQKGDSLARIASQMLGSETKVKAILAANPGLKDPNRISIGQELVIPSLAEGASTEGAPATNLGALAEASARRSEPAAPIAPETGDVAGGRYHVVQKNEVLGTIAKRYFGTTAAWRTIADANPQIDPNRMQIGARLVIPAGAR
jgi:nucleoid-associated protein YgaU